MSRKITVEIEIAGPDLSLQKDIDLLREILTKYHNWAIAGIKMTSPQEVDIEPYPKSASTVGPVLYGQIVGDRYISWGDSMHEGDTHEGRIVRVTPLKDPREAALMSALAELEGKPLRNKDNV
jgi:hypothetical protein